MILALAKAFGQFSDPAFRRVAWRGMLWSIALMVALTGLGWGALGLVRFFEIGWLDQIVTVFGGFTVVVLVIILFPGAVVVVLSLYLEPICRAVEDRHYPGLPPPRPQSAAEQVWAGARLAGAAIVLNLLVLPLYFVPVVNLLVFFALNGYLLGREYFELVALRRNGAAVTRALRRRHRLKVLLAGVVAAVILSLPLINWFLPVVAAAFMVHLYQALPAESRGAHRA